jgi:hypothetical protein
MAKDQFSQLLLLNSSGLGNRRAQQESASVADEAAGSSPSPSAGDFSV